MSARSMLLISVLYAAVALLVAGVTWRVWRWARTPEPFCIPTTSGQQASLRWIRPGRIESPSSAASVVGRLLLETLLFRSLFRNTAFTGSRTPASQPGTSSLWPRMGFIERKALWIVALAFHWSLLLIVVRHLRFFLEPVPRAVNGLAAVDGFFQVGVPGVYLSDAVVALALLYLLARRLREPLLRYLTLPADYLALGILIAVVASGLVTRHLARPDLVAVKRFTLGLVSFAPGAPSGLSAWVVVHLLLVSTLVAIFPFGKLMHAAGVWLSPTRNQRADSRRRRHVNPWNAPVPVHTYAEWEDEFREKMRAAGLPLEKE